MQPQYVRTDIWREGKYVDLWSVVHLLSGSATAFALSVLPFDMPATFVIAFLLFVAYELWEALESIEETPQNRVMDVVVGMASFTPTYLVLIPHLSRGTEIVVFAAILGLDIVLATFGWLASRKAAILERKMRQQYAQRMARLRERVRKNRT